MSENLEENESTWIVIYRPVSGYEFRLSSEENTKEAFEFRQEITFGPGVSPRTRARAATVVQDKVRAVALAGEPGFSAEQVLAGTKLRQGDRFEFRAWLEDRDRIVRFYRDREYYTARVVPMRTAAESTGKERPVDLQYRIARGRRTVLEVTGYAGGDDLLNRLRQTWSDNVVLDLLDDRLTKATREHLIDAGFLRARIEVEVDRPDSDTDRARVRIDPGLRTGSRQLAFRGNQVLATQTLQELDSVGSTRCQRVDGSGPADRCDPRGIRGEGLSRGARHHRANRVRGRRRDVADSDRRGAGGAGGGGPADGRCARAAGWSARGDRPCRGVAIYRRGGSIRTRPAGALLPRPRISRRAAWRRRRPPRRREWTWRSRSR